MQQLKKIASSSDTLFETAMDIYMYSFPANERQAIETIRMRLDKGLYILYTACENDEVLAMLLLYPLEDTEFIIIDYLAVNKDHRKKGIGAWLIVEVLNVVQVEYRGKYLILESEDPDFGNNKTERADRVAFYKKLGARTLQGVNYILPPLSGDEPTQMILMILPGYNGDSLPRATIQNLVMEMYRQLYGRGPDDVLLRSVIAHIPLTVNL